MVLQGTQRGSHTFKIATSTCCPLLPGDISTDMLVCFEKIIIVFTICFWSILTQLSLRCQAWIETEYGHHNILNAGGSRTAESSIFSYDEVSLSDAGGGNKQESTYLYIQMEYCPRCVSFCSCAPRKFVLLFLHYFFYYVRN
jgi:hypothetical protein